MKSNNLAPVLILAYNRPEHLKKTLASLKKNFLSERSKIIIHCDGYKNKEKKNVKEVRKIAKSITGFKSKKVIFSKKNLGLKKSIIKNVSKYLKIYKKLIILEDDIITSKFFLRYMNQSLIYFKDKKKIWHITGHSHFIINNGNDIFFSSYMNCWGWATWQDRWKHLDLDVKKAYISLKTNKSVKNKFDINNLSKFSNQIFDNYNKKINTWAIFWYWTIFKNKKLCIHPFRTLTKNIGQDGTGVHKDIKLKIYSPLKDKSNFNFNLRIKESRIFKKKLITFYMTENSTTIKIITKIYRVIYKFYNIFYVSR